MRAHLISMRIKRLHPSPPPGGSSRSHMKESIMKTRIGFALFSAVTALAICLGAAPAAAAEMNSIPTEEDFAPYWEEAARQPVVPDKGASPISARDASYPTRKGVILVTGDKFEWIPSGHAAIIYSSSQVVESMMDGVTTGPNDWNSSKNVVYGLKVNDTSISEDYAAADWCYSQRGKPYNWNFFDKDTRSAFYCSQLVWAAYNDLYGIDLDTPTFGSAVYPTELVSCGETSTIYLQF